MKTGVGRLMRNEYINDGHACRRIGEWVSVDPLFCPTSTCSIMCPFDTLQ